MRSSIDLQPIYLGNIEKASGAANKQSTCKGNEHLVQDIEERYPLKVSFGMAWKPPSFNARAPYEMHVPPWRS
eukprot:750391-Hanusia_phi.AAC.3